MATAYDYTAGKKITITNVIDAEKYIACDAGTPVTKVLALYEDIKDLPCVKWDYIFTEEGEFAKGKKQNGVVTVDAEGTDYVVNVYKRFKTSDRVVPAYRTFNGKVLKAGDSVVFNSTFKDEIVFYEKFAAAFPGEVTVTFEAIESGGEG